MLATIEDALNLCKELGKIIASTEEFKMKKQCEKALLHDEEARKLMEEAQILRQKYQKMQLAGYIMTEEDKKALEQAELKALNNPIARQAAVAHEAFHNMMQQITEQIKKGIKEFDRD